MKVFTEQLQAEVLSLPTYSAQRDYLREVKRVAGQLAQILDQSITTFEMLGRVATAEEHQAIMVQAAGILASQPDTDDYEGAVQ